MDHKIYAVLETYLGARGRGCVPGSKLISLYVPRQSFSNKQNYDLENQPGENARYVLFSNSK